MVACTKFTVYSIVVAIASSAPKSYVVQFEGNNSRKWDGKKVYIEREVLDELYNSTKLIHGAKILYPWRGKDRKLTHWNAIFVDPVVSGSAATGSSISSCITTTDTTATGTTTTGSVRPAATQMGVATVLQNNGLYVQMFKLLIK